MAQKNMQNIFCLCLFFFFSRQVNTFFSFLFSFCLVKKLFQESGHGACIIVNEFQVQSFQRITGLVALWVSEKSRVGDHGSRDARVPKRGMVAQPHFGEIFSLARNQQGFHFKTGDGHPFR